MAAPLPTVLVVDDDPRMRDLLSLLLRFSKFDVLLASTPAEALDALRASPEVGLVITDIVLPDMNGYDLADELLAIRPEMPVVFMSGFASDAVRRVVDAPVLAKPFTVEQLLEAVGQAMRQVS